MQVVEKFLTKMTNEENKYQDHLAELDGAMNPDAEAVVTQVKHRSRAIQFVCIRFVDPFYRCAARSLKGGGRGLQL